MSRSWELKVERCNVGDRESGVGMRESGVGSRESGGRCVLCVAGVTCV